jgi:hypothetical protein
MVTLVNRAKMSTATTGTGTITLGTAESGYQTFADAGVVDTNVVRYVIEDGTAWEIGTGTYSAGTLTRVVSESSNADAALNLTGSAVVFVSATAEDIPAAYTNNDVDAHLNTGTATTGEVLSWTGTDYDWIAAGGGGTALELYAENPVTPIAPIATGNNAVAIGSESVSAGLRSVSLGDSYASGTDSFAASVANNTSSYGATGANSVAIGRQAKAHGQDGKNSPSSGSNSISIGLARASGNQSVAIGGGFVTSSATASANESFALGDNAKATELGKYAYSSHGGFSGSDRSQYGLLVLRSDTTGDTPEALTSNNSTAGTTNQVILPNNSAYAFHGTIVARQQASQGTACAAWKIEGLIRREGSAGTTVLVNSATTVLDNTPAWGMALSADTTYGGLKIEVTGAAATNIRFVASIHTSEVTY